MKELWYQITNALGKLIKTCYFVVAAIICFSEAKDMGGFINFVKSFCIGMVVFTIFFYFIKTGIRYVGKSYISIFQDELYRKPQNFSWGGGSYTNSGRYTDKSKEADQRAWERWKAGNEAVWQQNQANQKRGTYEGYRAQNRANAARDRAKRY